jgi:CheY-like chemotaxis protein
MVKSCHQEITGTEMARILFVDDDPLTLETYSHIIGFYGHDVLIESTAEQALKTASEEMPDLLVLDMNLPDLHGFDLLRRLRKNTKTAEIPAVMVSASPNALAKSAVEAGAQEFRSKPVLPDELLAIIDKYTSNDA